ncbi:MAG: Prenylcysteine lyase-domain-containing protein [Benniella sp.]|nr:MAG: Prenylcysteine lyase-domain-containing protein [Benniella sp.]
MRFDYLSKANAAIWALLSPASLYLSNGQPHAKELAPVKSVAIIGAGAAGSSTAYYLNQFLQPPQLSYKHHHQVTIFEQSDRIGGRCRAFRVRNPGQKDEYIELGASIFVKVNHNLVNAAKEFGLKTKPLDDEMVAIWDGQQFIFEESQWKFWSIIKGLRRWGLGPFRMKFLLKTTLDDLLAWYKTTEAFDSISGFAKRFRLDKVSSIMSNTFLKKHGLGPDYSKEVVEVATRVNYGSNLDEIHALGALVTMAADDALQIQGGNFQIFEGMVGHSKANVQLNTKIARVHRLPPRDGEESLFEVTMMSGHKEIFNTVVLAAPIHTSGIDFDIDLPPQPKVSYRTIYATFVRGLVNPGYFNATSAEKFPAHILTTRGKAEFTSLSIQTKLSNGETVTKIFSPAPLEDELLDRLYLKRTWVKVKQWKAYPKLKPLPLDEESEELFSWLNSAEQDQVVMKDQQEQGQQQQQQQQQQEQWNQFGAWGQIEIVPGLYYVNAFEPFISTMETETIAGKNVARLVRDRILGYCPVEKKIV